MVTGDSERDVLVARDQQGLQNVGLRLWLCVCVCGNIEVSQVFVCPPRLGQLH